MTIIFFGSGKFAVRILAALGDTRHRIACVVTRPDRKKGRYLRVAGTPVKERALAQRLPLFQPEDINAAPQIDMLKGYAADLFLVVSYGRILSREVLGLPSRMCVNIHASLLPKYRGAAPISAALINGERRTGVTFIKMNEMMDRGDILHRKTLAIAPDDNALTLDDKLANLAAAELPELLDRIESGAFRLKKQTQRGSSYAPLLKKKDGEINWGVPRRVLTNRFRACFGWPGTFTTFRGKLLKITALEAGRRGTSARPGEIISAEDDRLEVACADGSVLIREVLPEAHKRMSVRSFLAGHHAQRGEHLGAP